jgi:hypothetical protein
MQVRNSAGTSVLSMLATHSNLNKSSSCVQSFDLSAWKGQTVPNYLEGIEGLVTATSFLIDDGIIK